MSAHGIIMVGAFVIFGAFAFAWGWGLKSMMVANARRREILATRDHHIATEYSSALLKKASRQPVPMGKAIANLKELKSKSREIKS